MDGRSLGVAAPPSPELLAELQRLRLENAQLRSTLEHLARDDDQAWHPPLSRSRWLAGRAIATVLFATGVAVATLAVATSRPMREIRGNVRAQVRDRLREEFRSDSRVDRAMRSGIRAGHMVIDARAVPPSHAAPPAFAVPAPPAPPEPPRP